MRRRTHTQAHTPGFAPSPDDYAPLCRPANSAAQAIGTSESTGRGPGGRAAATALSTLSCGLSLTFWFGGERLFALLRSASEWLWAAPAGPPGYGQLPGGYMPAAYLAMIWIALMSNALAVGGLWLSRNRDDRLTRAVVGVSLISSIPAMMMALFVLVDHEHSPLRWLGW